MRLAFLAVLLWLSACSSETDSSAGDGTERDHRTPTASDGSGSGPSFFLSGTVSNPFDTAKSGRLVAGVVPRSKFVPPIKCSSFSVKDDRAGISLPVSYSLTGLVAGDYVLTALVIDGTTPDAPFAAYGVTVEKDGVHYNSPFATSTLDLIIQGTVAYDCP